MGVARVWLGADLRRHWRRHVALAVMLGIVGAIVLATAAGARRTSSAYERFARAQSMPDLEVQTRLDHAAIQSLGTLPGVEAAGAYAPFFAAPSGRDLIPGQDFVLFAASDRSYARSVDRPLVLDGRLPNPATADEVVVGTGTAKSLHLRVGTELTFDSIPASQTEALLNGDFAKVTLDGPKPHARVVGIVRSRLDLETSSYAPAYAITTPAFYAAYHDQIVLYGELLDVRLTKGAAGADAYVAAARTKAGSSDDPDSFSVSRLRENSQSVRGAIHVQALALLLLTLVAAAAGLVAASQAVGRSFAATAPSHPVLAALGMDRAGRIAVTLVTFLPAAVGAAAIAVAGAWIGSRWFPPGLARQLEVHPGADIDGAALLLGASLLIALVLARAAFGAAGQQVTATPVIASSTKSDRLGQLGRSLPAAPGIGFRWALPRGGGSGPPTRAALAGAVVGVVGVVGALTYGAGLNRLVSTPAIYGWTFDAAGGGGDDPAAVQAIKDTIAKDKGVRDITVAHIVGSLIVNGKEMQAYGFEDGAASFRVSVVAGRHAAAPDEVVLGTRSARSLRVGIGGIVHVKSDNGHQEDLRVVGLGLFPTIETDRFTTGAAMTRAALDRLQSSTGYDQVLFRFAPGPGRAATEQRLRATGQIDSVAHPPPDIHNLDLVRNYPRWLAGFLALLALMAVSHALVVSSRRRRRQMGVLSAIGLTRRQLGRVVSSQGLTFAVVGVVVGVPLGIAAGRWAWFTNADRIGVGTHQPVPGGSVALVAAAALVAVGIIAAAIGRMAAPSRVARALRDE